MTRDEYIQTEVLRKCWHEIQTSCLGDICLKCKEETFGFAVLINPNFSTSRAYELQQFVLGAEWWEEFFRPWAIMKWQATLSFDELRGHMLLHTASPCFAKWLFSDADRFADLVAEFRGYKPSGGTYETA
jgi:hypothetical protein